MLNDVNFTVPYQVKFELRILLGAIKKCIRKELWCCYEIIQETEMISEVMHAQLILKLVFGKRIM